MEAVSETPGYMSAKPHENLKSIRFEGELLPKWAQLLDLAAGLCPVSNETRDWFSRLTRCSGVDAAHTIVVQCQLLRAGIQEQRPTISVELQRSRYDSQPEQILRAWTYALDTMLQEARGKKTCCWIVEDSDDAVIDGSEGGDITLRRV